MIYENFLLILVSWKLKVAKFWKIIFMTIFLGHFSVLSPYLEAKLANIMESDGYLE
jgi:hypothetical protein